ncbi:MAG: hypothetical protein IJ752_08430 [Alphaproteobacteria bacterium]|nr:hypothetical protein [Alphaproteobacteria bacterium]
MRSMSLIHTVLASLLWCAVVFIFVGMNFMKFEAASGALHESRIKTALTELHKTIQLEMDKGEMLAGLKTAGELLLRYANDETDLLSVSIFETKTGKVLFGTEPSALGQIVPDSWRKKCSRPNEFFTVHETDKESFGIPVQNAFLENVGCLTAVYTMQGINAVRERMIRTAFRYAFRLAAIGVSICFSFYFFSFLVSELLEHKKIQLTAVLILCQGLLLAALYFNFTAMFRTFEADLREEIASKSRLIAGQIGMLLSHAVQSGVPFDSVTALEAYMDQIRQENKEILFILVTDKTGRVLYEAGSAAKAFEADPHTGKIFLRDGYYNTAAPVNNGSSAVGWVQIGVNERFEREKGL